MLNVSQEKSSTQQDLILYRTFDTRETNNLKID